MSAPLDAVVPDRGPAMMVIFWVESAIATLIVALRVYGRLLSSKLGADDYVMLFTLLLFLVGSGFVTFLAKVGGFRHQADLNSEQQMLAIKYNWITQEWGISGLVTGKVSVALQLLRITGPNNKCTRWTLYALIISLSVLTVVNCIITFTQCNPPRALWNPSIPHSCWDSKIQSNYAIFVGAYHVLGDLTLAILPIGIIMKTSLALQKRLATIALLGLGVVAAACGIVKVTWLVTLKARDDFTWNTYPLYIWTSLELWMVIVCGSIPPIRPLFIRLFGSQRTPPTSNYFRGGYFDMFPSTPTEWSRRLKQRFSDPYDGGRTGLPDSASDTQTLQPSVEVETHRCVNHGHWHHEMNDNTKIVQMTDIVLETR